MDNLPIIQMVEDFEKVKDSPRYQIGDIIEDLKNNKTYVKTLLNWEELNIEQTINAGNLYDLNRDAIKQMKPLNNEQKKALKNEIEKFDKKFQNEFYMLLNHELHYFTVFKHSLSKKSDFTYLENAVITILEELYTLITYDVYEDRIEIWGQDANDEVYVFIFFPYDAGVVTFNV